MVIVPPKASQGALGWWRIDPSTGQTLGIGRQGWGQATTEYMFWPGFIAIAVAALYCGLKSTNGVSLAFCVMEYWSLGAVMWFGAVVGGSSIAAVVLLLLTVGILAITPSLFNSPYDAIDIGGTVPMRRRPD